MGDPLLKLYHALPYPLRCLAASARGSQLRSWRYGKETDRLVEAALERETWSAGRWQEWQDEKLLALLKRAAELVPFYREKWEKLRAKDSSRSVLDLKDWPVLWKEEFRQNSTAFVAEDVPKRRLRVEYTSGTTGTPLQLWQSRQTARAWYALMEARWRGWCGLARADRWAILGGQLVTPIARKTPPFWVWNAGLKQLYLSSSHLSAETCAAYLKAIQEYRVTYLLGYASALYSLALFARELGVKPPKLSAVISNAEPLYAHQREMISRVFACPVRDTYGLSEMVCAASECEAGRMHLWPEVGIYEVLHDEEDKPVKWGETGRLICTGLLNRDMPLIRYEVGDRVAMASPGEKCPCGRTLPILLSVEGRSDDVIVTPDGRRIGRLDPVFKGDIPMREGQIIQESLELIRVLVVPACGFTARHERDLIAAVRERVGNIKVQVERVREIPRSANGKFRAVISKVGQADAVQKKQIKNTSLRMAQDWKMELYWQLPIWCQEMALSIHARYLDRLYFGSVFAKNCEAIAQMRFPDHEAVRSWQTEQLTKVITEAVRHVPYYRERIANARRVKSMADLQSIPILDKQQIREHEREFLDERFDVWNLYREKTSGTTGTSLTIYRDKDSLQRLWAANEVRVRHIAGVSQDIPRAMIGGRPVVRGETSRPPFWRFNRHWRQLYLSSYHISRRWARDYVGAIRHSGAVWLTGYGSAIAALAESAMQEGVAPLPMKVVIVSGDTLQPGMRESIQRFFECRCYDHYGQAEGACWIMECPQGRMHVVPEVGILELLDANGKPTAPGEVGQMVVTGLVNRAMPLIRYRIGDEAAWAANQECSCGQPFPIVERLEGRLDAYLITEDGRKIGRLSTALKRSPRIHSAQIVQDHPGHAFLLVRPGTGYQHEDALAIRDDIVERIGRFEIDILEVSEIPKMPPGKTRLVVRLADHPNMQRTYQAILPSATVNRVLRA